MAGIGGEYIPNAIRETLDSVVSPDVRERVIQAALEAESLRVLPRSPRRFREFLDGSLGEVIMKAFGPEVAEPILLELARIAAIAERDHVARTGSFPPDYGEQLLREPVSAIQPRQPRPDTRRTDPYLAGQLQSLLAELKDATDDDQPPSSRDYPLGTASALGVIGTATVEAGQQRLPLVLVASSHPDLVRSFSAWLDPRASVQSVTNLLSTVSELSEARQRRVVLVIDARSPSVKPLSLAAIADDLPPNASVVLWGMSAEGYAKMLRLSPAVAGWLVCGVDCPTSEVVAQCVRLVG